MNLALRIATKKETILGSIKVSLIVGLVLNVINQGQKIIELDFAHIDLARFLLTYLVPYLVSTYSTTNARMKFKMGDKSPIDVSAICDHCKETHVDINEGEIIPVCQMCMQDTTWKVELRH